MKSNLFSSKPKWNKGFSTLDPRCAARAEMIMKYDGFSKIKNAISSVFYGCIKKASCFENTGAGQVGPNYGNEEQEESGDVTLRQTT